MVAGKKGILESGESAIEDVLSHLLHQPQYKAQVMKGSQPVGQKLLALEEVMEICR